MTEPSKTARSKTQFTLGFCLFFLALLILSNPQELSHDRALQNWLRDHYHRIFTEAAANDPDYEPAGVFLPSARYYGERCYYRNYYIFSMKKYFDDDATATFGIMGFVHVVDYRLPSEEADTSNPQEADPADRASRGVGYL